MLATAGVLSAIACLVRTAARRSASWGGGSEKNMVIWKKRAFDCRSSKIDFVSSGDTGKKQERAGTNMMSMRTMPDPQVDELVRKWVQEAGITQRQIAAPEIIDRCIYALRTSDIDIIYLNGYGFPAHRGGPMWYADTGGLKQVLRASLRILSPARRTLEAPYFARFPHAKTPSPPAFLPPP